MPGGKGKRYRGLLFYIAWLVVIFLYSVSFYYSVRFFKQAWEQHIRPSVTVSFENMKQIEKVRFPSLQFCSLPREPLVPISCVFEDHPAPGAFKMHKHYSPIVPCEFEISYRNSVGQVVCWQVNTTAFEASSPTRFSSINIKIGVKPLNQARHRRRIDPFRDLKGLLVHIFDPNLQGATPLPFSGSLVLPAGTSSSVAITQQRLDFEVTSKPAQKLFRVETTFASYPKAATMDLQGNNIKDIMAARFYYGSLATQITQEAVTYDWSNAFGDATAVSGFFVGFTFWAGPGLAVWLWKGCGGRNVQVINL